MCFEPIVAIGIRSNDGQFDVLPSEDLIGEAIDISTGEKDRLEFKITDWKLVAPSLSDLFKRHLTLIDQAWVNSLDDILPSATRNHLKKTYDSAFDSVFSEVSKSGHYSLKSVPETSIQASLSCVHHNTITSLSINGINISDHIELLRKGWVHKHFSVKI